MDEQQVGQESAPGNVRHQREEALRVLAQRQESLRESSCAADAPASRLPNPFPRARQPGRNPLLVLGILLVCLALLAGTVVYLHGRGSPQSTHVGIPDVLQLNLTPLNLACPAQMLWSPDSTRIAVVAYERKGCEVLSTLPQVVAILDGRTGALQRILRPDAALRQAGRTGDWFDPAWSPDSTSLIVAVVLQPVGAQTAVDLGILSLPVHGGSPRLTTAPAAATSGVVSGANGMVWDTRSQALNAELPPLEPQALSYAWTNDEGITPAQAVPAAGSDLTGSPVDQVNAAQFSLWQPGTLDVIQPSGADQTSNATAAPAPAPAPVAVVYHASVTRWSPDARTVAIGIKLGAWLVSPATSGTATLDPAWCSAPIDAQLICTQHSTPPPDAALVAVERAVLAGFTSPNVGVTGVTQYPTVPIAWQPTGKLLATLLPADGFDARLAMLRVTLFDTTTGTPAMTLQAVRQAGGGSADPHGPSVLAWSPAGSQLALADYTEDVVTIWRV